MGLAKVMTRRTLRGQPGGSASSESGRDVDVLQRRWGPEKDWGSIREQEEGVG